MANRAEILKPAYLKVLLVLLLMLPFREGALAQAPSVKVAGISGKLSIARDYIAFAGSDATLSQMLSSDLSGATDSIFSFEEYVLYDPAIIDFLGANNGENTPIADWSIHATVATPGNIHIMASSSGYALKGPGELLRLVFHVNQKDPVFAHSLVWDTAAVFGAAGEPLGCDTGAIHVIGDCTPILGGNGFHTHLGSIAPNPAQLKTTLAYSIEAKQPDASSFVRIHLYDATGNLIRRVKEDEISAGSYENEIVTSDLPAGVYYVVFEADEIREMRPLFVIH